MNVRMAKLHPATVRAIAKYLERDAQELTDSFSELDGRIRQASVAREVRQLKVWAATLIAAIRENASNSSASTVTASADSEQK